MPPAFTTMNMDSLRELLGPPVEQLTCSLPKSSAAETLIREFYSSLEALTSMVKRLPIPNANMKEMLEGLNDQVNPERVREGFPLTEAVNWPKLLEAFEEMRSSLPVKTTEEQLAQYDRFLDSLTACAKSFSHNTFAIELVGDADKIEELAQRIMDDLQDMIENEQAELAEKYGWKRGKSTCCDHSPGYHPPEGSMLHVSHDASRTSGDFSDEITQMIARSMRGPQHG